MKRMMMMVMMIIIIIIITTQTNGNRNLIYQVLKTEFLFWRKYTMFRL